MNTMTNCCTFKTAIFSLLVISLFACNSATNQKGLTADSTTVKGLTVNPTTVKAMANVECLQDWKGCDWRGSNQATYNVRPDGTWEFQVRYGNGTPTCYKTGKGAPTSRGSVQHEEYLVDYSIPCLKLVNRIYF